MIELYRDALNGMIDEVWTENQILKVHSIVKTLKKAVIGSAQYALSIQGVMVNVHMLENLLNIVDKCCVSIFYNSQIIMNYIYMDMLS